jgi:hypothetical protein
MPEKSRGFDVIGRDDAPFGNPAAGPMENHGTLLRLVVTQGLKDPPRASCPFGGDLTVVLALHGGHGCGGHGKRNLVPPAAVGVLPAGMQAAGKDAAPREGGGHARRQSFGHVFDINRGVRTPSSRGTLSLRSEG